MNGWIVFGIIIGLSVVLLATIILFIIKIKLGRKWKEQERIGREAEEEIGEKISKWAKNNSAIFIPSALYKYNKNKLFEVDGILLTKRAIVVIEIKSINGKIKGNVADLNWRKILGNKSFEIANPVRQNENHIHHILSMLNGQFPILSMIIFSNRVNELNIINDLQHVIVIEEDEFEKTMFNISKELEPKLSNSVLNSIKNNLVNHVSTNKKDYMMLKSFADQK